jgi:outer membrane protein OmpA-like peptidoglycan-associated protein
MKSILAVILAGVLCLGGCSTLSGNPADSQSIPASRDSASYPRRGAAMPATAQRDRAPKTLAPRTDSSPAEPDSVIAMNPESASFSPEMEVRLAAIAGELAKDERLMIRLEGYVRSGGSPALAIGIADKLLFKVKDRLQSLGVPARRMLSSSFGGEHGKEPGSHGSWVEIYLIRPGNPSAPPGTAQK